MAPSVKTELPAAGAPDPLRTKITFDAEAHALHLAAEATHQRLRCATLHGLYRALSQGMVEGVTKGFSKRLEVVGVSYQASLAGQRLRLQVEVDVVTHSGLPMLGGARTMRGRLPRLRVGSQPVRPMPLVCPRRVAPRC